VLAGCPGVYKAMLELLVPARHAPGTDRESTPAGSGLGDTGGE